MKKLLIVSIFIVSFNVAADSSKVIFTNGWIKFLPPVVPVRAGYVQIKNPTGVDVEISGIESDVFESVEIHETRMENGMMTMEPISSIKIPAKSMVELKPGGKHMMMMSPKFPPAKGDLVNVTISFSDQQKQTLQMPVK